MTTRRERNAVAVRKYQRDNREALLARRRARYAENADAERAAAVIRGRRVRAAAKAKV